MKGLEVKIDEIAFITTRKKQCLKASHRMCWVLSGRKRLAARNGIECADFSLDKNFTSKNWHRLYCSTQSMLFRTSSANFHRKKDLRLEMAQAMSELDYKDYCIIINYRTKQNPTEAHTSKTRPSFQLTHQEKTKMPHIYYE